MINTFCLQKKISISGLLRGAIRIQALSHSVLECAVVADTLKSCANEDFVRIVENEWMREKGKNTYASHMVAFAAREVQSTMHEVGPPVLVGNGKSASVVSVGGSVPKVV